MISYSYQDVPLGTVRVDFNADSQEPSIFDTEEGAAGHGNQEDDSVIFVNLAFLLTAGGVLAVLLLLWLIARLILKNYHISPRSGRRGWRKRSRRRKRGSRKYRGPDF